MGYIREALDKSLEEENKKEIDEELYDDDWTIEDEDDIENYEEDDPITPEQEAFAKEIKSFLQSLIDNEEMVDDKDELEEEFTSQNSLIKHFKKHCLGNSKNKKSRLSSIYYDFTSIKQYSTYENKLDSLFDIGNKNLIVLKGPFDIDEVNKAFRKTFEGDSYVTFGWSWGFASGNKAVQLNIHSFSSDVTTNYKDGNTIDILIRTSSPKTITLYPVDASKLKIKLEHIFKKYSSLKLTPSKDDKKLLDSLNNNRTEYLNEDLSDDDKSAYLDKLDIKSNGIYSINYGWLKHPVPQDIPDIDMDEFEKEFKVWEDRYFNLIKGLE